MVEGGHTSTIGELSKFAVITDKEVELPYSDKNA